MPLTTTPKQRTRCEVWTRVMGYHRPVSHFNIGKKSEHYSRKHFTEIAAANSTFAAKYSVALTSYPDFAVAQNRGSRIFLEEKSGQPSI